MSRKKKGYKVSCSVSSTKELTWSCSGDMGIRPFYPIIGAFVHMIQAKMEELATLERNAPPEWQPFAKMPRNIGRVLVLCSDGVVAIASRRSARIQWESAEREGANITSWQPLPKAPNSSKEADVHD